MSAVENKDHFRRLAQYTVVLLFAASLKLYYSNASVNDLGWILTPTTFLVEIITGNRFEFESYAGYISGDRTFVIAAACAGLNFLITAFLMLSLTKLWKAHSESVRWRFFLAAALSAYLVTIIANAVRISLALQTHESKHPAEWLTDAQLHRLDGVVIYFCFLVLLFIAGERISESRDIKPHNAAGVVGQTLIPLFIYYAITLGIPIANGAFRHEAAFWEHTLFVLLMPIFVVLPLLIFRLYRYRRPRALI
jgi:exosortase K